MKPQPLTPALSPTLTVEQLFAQWPQATTVFLRRRFACIGCLMAPFDALTDVARNYGVPLAGIMAEIRDAVESKPAPGQLPEP